MRLGRTTLFSALVVASSIPSLASPHTRRGPTSQHLFTRHAPTKPTPRPTSQRGIDPERTTQIQSALIKQGYLTGEPTGKWDSVTQAALEKLQGDNGWQTKLTPDSRALIKLGLGPGTAPSSENAGMSGSSSVVTAQPATETQFSLPSNP